MYMLKSSAWELGTKPQREIALFSVAFNESLNFFYMSVRSRNAWGGGGRGGADTYFGSCFTRRENSYHVKHLSGC